MSRTFPLTIEPIDAAFAKHKKYVDEILALVPDLDPKRARGLFHHPASVVRRLLHLVGPLPASEDHHDSDAYGLFRHTLITVRESIKACHERFGHGDDDYQERITTTIIAALAHDIGKLFYLSATGPNGTKWKVIHGYLVHGGVGDAEFEGTFSPGDKIVVSFKYGRHRSGFRGHEPLAFYLIHLLISPSMTGWMGLEMANNLPAIVCASLKGEVRDRLNDFVKRGDQIAAEIGTKIKRPPSPVFASGGSRSEEFIVYLRALADQQKLKPNQMDGNVFVSRSHTVLPLQAKVKGAPDVFRLAVEYGRGQTHAIPQVGHWYRDTGADFYQELRTKCIQLGSESWMVMSGDPAGSEKVEFRHTWETISTQNRRSNVVRRGLVIIIPNRILWGDRDVESAFGLWEHPMGFQTYDGKSVSIVADDLGFKAMDAHAIGVGLLLDRERSPQPHAYDSLFDVAKNIWEALNRVTPLERGGNFIHKRLREIDAAVSGRAMSSTPESAMVLLAGGLDRIRDLASAVELGERSPLAQLPSSSPPASTSSPAGAVPGAEESHDEGDDDDDSDRDVDPDERKEQDDKTAITTALFTLILSARSLRQSPTPDANPLIIRSANQFAMRWPEAALAVIHQTRPHVTGDQVLSMSRGLLRMAPICTHLGIVATNDGVVDVTFPTGRWRAIVFDLDRMGENAEKTQPPHACPRAVTWTAVERIEYG